MTDGDDATVPPFPFGDLPPLPDAVGEGDQFPAAAADELPSWLAMGGFPLPDLTPAPDPLPEPLPEPPVSVASIPYWPNMGLDESSDDVNAVMFRPRRPRADDTLSDSRPDEIEFPVNPSTVDQVSPTERMPTDAPEQPRPVEDDDDDLPLPPPFSARLSEFSPFMLPKPDPEPLPPEESPALTRTPPPAAQLDIPPVSAIWRTRRVSIMPRLEDEDTVSVFRIVVRDEAGRGYPNCKVTFQLPAGLKQVQASRKPSAKRGTLHWHLGPLGPDDAVPLSVKLPVALIGPELAVTPRIFEVAYQPLPGARLVGELASPSVVSVDQPFTITLRVSNVGELPTSDVTLRVLDRSHGGPPVLVEAPPIAPGDAVTLTAELEAKAAGRHDWIATVESSGSESSESIFATEAVGTKLAVELKHESMMRVDDEQEVTLVITNSSPIPVRGVTAMLTMPEELTFASAPGGEFDRALNLIGWLVGDLAPNESRAVAARLRGFAPGLVAIQARAEAMTGAAVVTTSNLFVEVDARSTSSTLDKLLAAIQDAIPDDDEPEVVRERVPEVGSRYVVFELGHTPYAVRIENVREVVRSTKITPVPGMPDWLPGVANVRGDILSLVDLPRFLNVDDGESPRRGVLVAQSDDGQLVIGLLVNTVVGIRRLPPSRPLEHDLLGDGSLAEYLDGVAELNGKLVPILDLNALFTSSELNAFQMS
ncbi:chemotaxis protein CheW [Limnoglobus roseus]|uniref:Chemotaxis protein CheW n=1 Tax=Limnoglobus roseus TaxID=2598579 RepID=A0A5C1AE63_9BACT|nr:chemotaxis protein CheW [Limnoglobus roseus]QEL15414.1 chemotaxis protein CheW [Limnoglobus roseus]